MASMTSTRWTRNSDDGAKKLDYEIIDPEPVWAKSTTTCTSCESEFSLSKASYGPQHFFDIYKVKYAYYSADDPAPAELTKEGYLVSDYRSLRDVDVSGNSGQEKHLCVTANGMTAKELSEWISDLDLNCKREGCWRDVVLARCAEANIKFKARG